MGSKNQTLKLAPKTSSSNDHKQALEIDEQQCLLIFSHGCPGYASQVKLLPEGEVAPSILAKAMPNDVLGDHLVQHELWDKTYRSHPKTKDAIYGRCFFLW